MKVALSSSAIPVISLFVLMGATSAMPPLHASCQVKWKVLLNCFTAKTMLTDQIQIWNMSSKSNCKETHSEKCLYNLKFDNDTVVMATHTTPTLHFMDKLTFTFSKEIPQGCCINAHSVSEKWFALLDFSTNYCNLRNLADGSGLSKSPEFKEITSSSNCTQFSYKNCNKY